MKVLIGLYIMVLAVFSILLYALTPRINNCTIFTIHKNETTVYGNNEDWHNGDIIINYRPSTDSTFGNIMFGYREGETQAYQGGINDQGLAWDTNSLPPRKITPHPEKPYHIHDDNMLYVLTTQISTVEDAISLFEQVDFGSEYPLQLHIADKTGDAVIISPGEDGEMAFTRIEGDFLISTNFNHAIEGHGRQGWRYDTAYEMLENYNDEPLQSYGMDVLEAVKLNMLTTFTVYSYSADLTNNTIEITYKSQFDDSVVIDMDEKLNTYNGYKPLSTLFPQDVVEKGDQAYNHFETRFYIAVASIIVLALFIVVTTIYFIIRRIWRRKLRMSNI